MRTVGIIFSGLGVLVALFGVVVGIKAIPDVKRYLRMRAM